jgi:ribose transport system substrate-binding protein
MLSLLIAAMMIVSACGSSGGAGESGSGKKVTIDVGAKEKITVEGPPRIAFFTFGSNNNYMDVINPTIKKEVGKIPGATFTMFDPQFNSKTQLQQMESALVSKKYNAWIVDAVDGDVVCNIATKQAPAADIAVVTVAAPLCGLGVKPNAEDHWAPGTVAIVDNLSIDFLVDWYEYLVKENPGPQKVIVVTGPETHPTYFQHSEALKKVQEEHPEFKVLAIAATDFSRLKAAQVSESLLTANPDATLIMGIWSDGTQGILTAVQSAGLTGKIKVYDRGGSGAIIDAIKQGTVVASSGNYPVGAGTAAVKALRLAFEGNPGPHVILNDGGPIPSSATKNGLVVIDKSNVDEFKVEYGVSDPM